jgi:hypothetical protein
VWLPKAAGWNGKFLAVGNPGFIGGIARGAKYLEIGEARKLTSAFPKLFFA